MSARKDSKPASVKALGATGIENIFKQSGTGGRGKTPKQLPNQNRGGVGKNSANYWQSRIYKPVNDRGEASPHYAMQLQFRGKRLSFSLRTGNQAAAAAKAAGIYGDLLTLGIEKTLLKHRAQTPKGENVATIGEYLTAAKVVMDVRPATFAAYSVHLRRIAGDILNKRTARKAKNKAKLATRKVIEASSLSVLTPEALQAWRLAFVSRAGADGRKARSARISSNSLIRQARSLFAPKVVKFLNALRLPEPLPFSGVEFFPRESMRYTSKIDAGIIMRTAREQLEKSDPDAFLIMLLALGAGLRRGEIDRLLWRHIDFAKGQIFIEESEHGSLKSEDSRGAVDIDASTLEILQGFKGKATGQFLINAFKAGEGEASRSWGLRYRCVTVFERVNGWLRAHGVEGAKALHTLRKEAGSIIASRDGIFAASQFLRHADIAVTAAHYADQKKRTVIDMGGLLNPEPALPKNVITMPKAKAARKPRRKSA